MGIRPQGRILLLVLVAGLVALAATACGRSDSTDTGASATTAAGGQDLSGRIEIDGRPAHIRSPLQAMHAGISGTIDFREKDEPSCLERLRRLIESLPKDAGERNGVSRPMLLNIGRLAPHPLASCHLKP